MGDAIISVISGEIAPDLKTAIRFARQHGSRPLGTSAASLAALRRLLGAAAPA